MLKMLDDPRSVRSIHTKKATAACTVRQHVWGTDVYESAYRNTKCRVVVWLYGPYGGYTIFWTRDIQTEAFSLNLVEVAPMEGDDIP